MKYVGDFTPGKTVRLRFNTHQSDGTPITLAGTPTVSVYKGSTTESTSGVTLTVDYDSRTGLHDVVVDTSADGTFYAAGNDFDVVITAGTVNSVSVVGTVVGTFSLSNRSALRPIVADRELYVDVNGYATAGDVASGAITSASFADGAITSAKLADGAIKASTFGSGAIDAAAIAAGAITSSECPALANLDAAVSTRLASASYTAPLDAAGTRTAVGLASANLDTQLAAIAGYIDTEVASILAAVDTEVAAIKAKTDQLTFTSANKVDATLQAAADLATAVAQKVAHVVLRRTMAAVEAAADGDTLDLSSLYGLVQQAQESAASGSTLTVKKTDGTTTLGTKTLTTNASADPVTGVS